MKRNYPKEPKIKPEVGMGACMNVGSDAYGYEIIEVINPKHVVVRRYDTRLVGGYILSEHQEYEFIPNPKNRTKHLVFRYGRWWGNTNYPRRKLDSKYEYWTLGEAYEYQDPCF